ncbi:hypothetical protein CYMTET_41354 [Cymbomonas tetramitiformis]|uniref:FAD-binding domain-containing protein n=1 Tax=Cymbomonas tetramitiformis TaxID=36881 RepID=A0AAE0C8B3_9CHLO|nr:hypothetical protein CYMTET_41354 [Cymbomonas tetramitiformis]
MATLNPVEAAHAFFEEETPVGVMNKIRELREACGVDETGLKSYEGIKSKTQHHHRCKQLWDILDKKRASSEAYTSKVCEETNVLVVGAGPAGLRVAIDLLLMGANVVVVEKRPYLTRNNVLHLWQSTVSEGIELGLKFFYKKFCAGGMDHISIRRLQIILAKVFVILGGKLHLGVTFNGITPPSGPSSPPSSAGENPPAQWQAMLEYDGTHPELAGAPSPPLEELAFHVIIGADGEQSHVARVAEFETKTFQGPRALGITFNFQNLATPAESELREFAIVRYAAPEFFTGLQETHGLQLENCTYYRDETHYYVMAASKASLVDTGVLKENFPEIPRLLHKSNIDTAAFERAARGVAEACKLPPGHPFQLDRYGGPDWGIFDFTKKRSMVRPAKVFEHHGSRLLIAMVGDALIAPFWPEGTGSNRCFLGARDLAWMVHGYAQAARAGPQERQEAILRVLQNHEDAFKLLRETPSSLNTKAKPFNLCDPFTRYTRYPRDTAGQPLRAESRGAWVCPTAEQLHTLANKVTGEPSAPQESTQSQRMASEVVPAPKRQRTEALRDSGRPQCVTPIETGTSAAAGDWKMWENPLPVLEEANAQQGSPAAGQKRTRDEAPAAPGRSPLATLSAPNCPKAQSAVDAGSAKAEAPAKRSPSDSLERRPAGQERSVSAQRGSSGGRVAAATKLLASAASASFTTASNKCPTAASGVSAVCGKHQTALGSGPSKQGGTASSLKHTIPAPGATVSAKPPPTAAATPTKRPPTAAPLPPPSAHPHICYYPHQAPTASATPAAAQVPQLLPLPAPTHHSCCPHQAPKYRSCTTPASAQVPQLLPTKRPSTAAATTKRPSTAAATPTKRPSTAAATPTKRPSNAAATPTKRPSTAASASSKRPATKARTHASVAKVPSSSGYVSAATIKRRAALAAASAKRPTITPTVPAAPVESFAPTDAAAPVEISMPADTAAPVETSAPTDAAAPQHPWSLPPPTQQHPWSPPPPPDAAAPQPWSLTPHRRSSTRGVPPPPPGAAAPGSSAPPAAAAPVESSAPTDAAAPVESFAPTDAAAPVEMSMLTGTAPSNSTPVLTTAQKRAREPERSPIRTRSRAKKPSTTQVEPESRPRTTGGTRPGPTGRSGAVMSAAPRNSSRARRALSVAPSSRRSVGDGSAQKASDSVPRDLWQEGVFEPMEGMAEEGPHPGPPQRPLTRSRAKAISVASEMPRADKGGRSNAESSSDVTQKVGARKAVRAPPRRRLVFREKESELFARLGAAGEFLTNWVGDTNVEFYRRCRGGDEVFEARDGCSVCVGEPGEAAMEYGTLRSLMSVHGDMSFLLEKYEHVVDHEGHVKVYNPVHFPPQFAVLPLPFLRASVNILWPGEDAPMGYVSRNVKGDHLNSWVL